MSSMASTFSPNSLQLRFAINSKHHRLLPPPRARLSYFDRYTLPICAVHCRNGVEPKRRRQLVVSCSAADNFAGWTDSEDADQSLDPDGKKSLQGIVGAGLAGLILVAGLTFAALSLSKRSSSRPKQYMEPLTAQQEVALVSTSEDAEDAHNKSEESSVKLDDSTLDEAPRENELDEANTANYTSASSVDTDEAPVQEDLQYESTFDAKLEAPEMTPESMDVSHSEIADHSLASSFLQSIPETEINLINGEPTDLSNIEDHITDLKGGFASSYAEEILLLDSSDASVHISSERVAEIVSVTSTVDTISEPGVALKDDNETIASLPMKEDTSQVTNASTEINSPFLEVNHSSESTSPETTSMTEPAYPIANEQNMDPNNDTNISRTIFESPPFSGSFSSAGIPAPSAVSEARQISPGKVLVPAAVDQAQGHALSALQVLKVIEADVQPGDLCTRREYARWLVSASSALSRNTLSKVYPAMYIENATELAFDDITPNDPDFSSIQGLAEAGLISSRLSSYDLVSSSNGTHGSFYFSPESPLSRQDLVSWKMALEKRQLPEADKKVLYQLSGFRDIDKINPDAWPALIADLSATDQGIISLAFGCTRLFQPDKPVTKAQAAIALATGEGSDIVNEELARIEAESIAENAVFAHNALVAQVEQDINASFEKELFLEREKINAVEKMAEEATLELQRLRTEREADNIALMKERAAIEAEMEMFSRLRSEVEEQLQSLMSSKVEISYEKERISKLQKEAENEKQEISRLQYELEVERKALSMARAWAEDEAKRAREHARVIEEARDRWERHGIKVVVDNDLREESSAAVTWATAGNKFSTEETVSRAENLVDKLKLMAENVKGKSKEVIHKVVQKILALISLLKEWASRTSREAKEVKDATILKAKGSVHELRQNSSEFSSVVKEKARVSMQGLQHTTAELGSNLVEGAKRAAGDCRENVGKFTQKFKS
ncbi:hypothetical protein M5689_017851 [Euphorbia peplus]|nr:hypothetical protein M5689_017851 [Euphorbia peplus]